MKPYLLLWEAADDCTDAALMAERRDVDQALACIEEASTKLRKAREGIEAATRDISTDAAGASPRHGGGTEGP